MKRSWVNKTLIIVCILCFLSSFALAGPEISFLRAKENKLRFQTTTPCFEFPLSLVERNGEFAGKIAFWHSWLKGRDGAFIEVREPIEFHNEDVSRCASMSSSEWPNDDFSVGLLAHGREELWLAGVLEEEGNYSLSVSLEHACGMEHFDIEIAYFASPKSPIIVLAEAFFNNDEILPLSFSLPFEVKPEVIGETEFEIKPSVSVNPIIDFEPVFESQSAIKVEPKIEVAPLIEITPEIKVSPVTVTQPLVEIQPIISIDPILEPQAPITLTPKIELEPSFQFGTVSPIDLPIFIDPDVMFPPDSAFNFEPTINFVPKWSASDKEDNVSVVLDLPRPDILIDEVRVIQNLPVQPADKIQLVLPLKEVTFELPQSGALSKTFYIAAEEGKPISNLVPYIQTITPPVSSFPFELRALEATVQNFFRSVFQTKIAKDSQHTEAQVSYFGKDDLIKVELTPISQFQNATPPSIDPTQAPLHLAKILGTPHKNQCDNSVVCEARVSLNKNALGNTNLKAGEYSSIVTLADALGSSVQPAQFPVVFYVRHSWLWPLFFAFLVTTCLIFYRWRNQEIHLTPELIVRYNKLEKRITRLANDIEKIESVEEK